MAKQDDFIRITLRLPPDVHEKLVQHSGANSLNAEIVRRLNESLSTSEELLERTSHLKNAVESMITRVESMFQYEDGKIVPKNNDTDR